MSKIIYHPHEVIPSDKRYLLGLTKEFEEPEILTVEDEEPKIELPDIEELQSEAEQFKRDFALQKKEMIKNAEDEAAQIISEAEQKALEELERKTEEAEALTQQAQDEVTRILSEAETKAQEILAEAEASKDAITKEAHDTGVANGREEGFAEGQAEVNRLIERLHTVIERTMARREEILLETEQHIVDLVLLMTRKVVKVISENQRNVVASNILHALRKVKRRGDVIIRVNLADLKLTTEHTKDFIKAVENVENISVAEDSTVDPGGCIIETDFGTIDARIVSQLQELEQRILEVSPIKTHPKPPQSDK